jgi:hypothetical protein
MPDFADAFIRGQAGAKTRADIDGCTVEILHDPMLDDPLTGNMTLLNVKAGDENAIELYVFDRNPATLYIGAFFVGAGRVPKPVQGYAPRGMRIVRDIAQAIGCTTVVLSDTWKRKATWYEEEVTLTSSSYSALVQSIRDGHALEGYCDKDREKFAADYERFVSDKTLDRVIAHGFYGQFGFAGAAASMEVQTRDMTGVY